MIDLNVQNIDNAISKSRVDRPYSIFRGVKDDGWLKKLNVSDSYIEKAYSSFSLDIKKALEYTNPENPILLQLELKKGMNALYVDETENEIICPRKMSCRIEKIEQKWFTEEINNPTKIYYLESL